MDWKLRERDVDSDNGVNLTGKDLLLQYARLQDLYFNISEMKLSITSLYIISDSLQGVNLSVQDLLCQDARIQELYFNISEMKLSITSQFSVQIMSYLGASHMIYSDEIDSFISEILKYDSMVI